MGSQDSLLEITFRARPPSEPSSSCTGSGTPQSLGDGGCDPSLPRGSSSAPEGPPGPGGLGRSGVRLECFRFPAGEEAPSSPLGERVLGALEMLRFRESGIGSEYESNTDESDDRDSWGQAEAADSSARLAGVLDPEALPDCLGEEVAV